MASESKKTAPSAPAPSFGKLGPKQLAAGKKILSAMQAHHKRVQQKLETVGPEVYKQLRVYHGTHDSSAATILEQGLKPQGGKGISAMIGDTSRAKGSVFFTRDKEQAAYYALTAAGMHQVDLLSTARKADNETAVDRIFEKPPRATVMRLMLSPDVQKQAVHDDKADTHDFMLQRSISAGLVLPGHLETDTNMSKRNDAVMLFRSELHQRGVFATPAQASASLARLRSNSITSDKKALASGHATSGAAVNLQKYKMMSGSF